MNIYVIVEGESATKKLYKNWIPFVNTNLRHVDYLPDVTNDNFYILHGYGQPYFLERVERAINDVNNLQLFNRLVIAVDSENADPYDKQSEISNRVDRIGCRVEVRYVIQHFCLETWLLGNRQMFRRKLQDTELSRYVTLFDVRLNDPTLLPNNEEKAWNRAQFAYHYLRAGIRDAYRGKGTVYSKKNPGLVTGQGYFSQVKKRCLDEQHILSFHNFLDAFT